MEPRKQAIISALRRFIRQRPGMDPRNYDAAGYRSESREVTKDRKQAETLLDAVSWRDGIDADALIRAAQGAYSGRLTIESAPEGDAKPGIPDARIDYTTGQYFPTEYRKAVCAVLASALWDWTRDTAMPAPRGDGTYEYARNGRVSAVSAGDWLRAHFAREFGRGIASRWFN